jgi:hypothetical protein
VFNVQNPLSFTGLSNNGCVAVGDLNHDGVPDAVLTNFGSGYGAPYDSGTPATSITVLYGRQGGGFTRAQLNTGGSNVSFVALADINSDGWLDAVAVNSNQQNTGTVAVFRNDGITGTLSMVGTPISTFGNNSSWVGLADVTGDNVLDLIAAGFGKANGNESVTGQSVTIFQGNADGQGHGNFTFSSGPITTLVPELQFIPTSLAIADFDGDGIRDIAAAVPGVPPDFDQPQPDGNVYVFRGTGSGGFAAPNQFDTGGALPVNIQAADVNGDGKPDLIVANAGDPNANPEFSNDSVGVLLNASQTGAPNFAVATSLTANTYGTFAVAVADFNMDGKQDIAAVNYGSQFLSPAAFVSFYQGNGLGQFTAGSPGTYDTKTLIGGGQYLAVGDFDGNGSPDLIVAHASNRVGLLLNVNAASVAPTVTGVTTNDGLSPQRSRITSVNVTFSGVVVLPANPASAFTLTYTGTPGGGAGGVIGSTVGGFTVSTAVVNGVTVATLSNFTGTDTVNGSLIDGRYTLKVTGSAVTINGTPMAADYTFADSGATSGNQLYRLFGDANGDRVVNSADLTLFRVAFGASLGDPSYNLAFDVDGDGVINQTDLAAFRANFGSVV